MRKGLFAICLSLVVAIVLLAVLVPSCTPTTRCTIDVKATLCGAPWQGAVNYTLTPTGGSPTTGTTVPTSFTVAAGNWSCAYVSGFPPGAYFVDITPSSPQTLAAGGNITFTLNFELNQDATIEFITWSVDGEPWLGPTLEVVPCHIIDVHFQQWVDGCRDKVVAVNETSWLYITYLQGPTSVQILVVNDLCALNKTPIPQGPTPEKLSQVPSFNGQPVEKGWLSDPQLPGGPPILLDVETAWQLVKCLNYTKSINWFGISLLFVPEPHPCVLFELLLPGPGYYTFTLQAFAEVALVDDTDVNPDNNHAMGPPLFLIVNAVGGP